MPDRWFAAQPPVLGIAGFAEAGKTTLIEGLDSELSERGYLAACIKHAPHGFEFDKRGSDSDRIFRAGAAVIVASDDRVMSVRRNEGAPSLRELVRSAGDASIVLVEAYHAIALPRIEVTRAGAPLRSRVTDIIALVGDGHSERWPCFAPADVQGVADFVEQYFGLWTPAVQRTRSTGLA
jgi:molybdopterin-guanine dinucleotide biosynthesis protein MobB